MIDDQSLRRHPVRPPALPFLLLLVAPLGIVVAADPADPGPHEVVVTGYDFGPTAWSDPVSRERCGFSARVYHPAELADGSHPLVLVLHGRHEGTYDPATGNATNVWPPRSGWLPIPNAAGYGWIAEVLASRGCIVVSVEANAVTAFDTFYGDYGDGIRQRLALAHLRFWQDLDEGAAEPFGDRFVGRLDLGRVGLLGHSRGGAVMARLGRQLQEEGAVGLAAVALLAPTNGPRVDLPDVPAAVLAGQLDGDVSTLSGVHYFDDARWRSTAPRYLAIVDGANHNFFNSNWDPSVFDTAAKDDNAFAATFQLDGDAQRAAAAHWLAAFFDRNLFADQRWQQILIGEQALPGGVACRISWQPAQAQCWAINSGDLLEHAAENELGGAVAPTGSLTATSIGGGHPLPDHLLTEHHSYREVHWSGDQPYFPASPGLRQHHLSWSATDAVWRNTVPAPVGDWRGRRFLLFRLGVNFEDSANTADQAQDLTVRLTDADGATASVRLSDHSDAGIWPIGTELDGTHPFRTYMPRLVLFQARLPLDAFTTVDRAAIRAVELRFDRRSSGAVVLADLATAGSVDRPPTASGITLSDATPAVGATIVAGLSNAVDPDGDDLSITWDWGDGSTASGTAPSHAYSTAGRYVVSAHIAAGGAAIRLQRAVTVAPGASNQAPTCTAFSDLALVQGAVPAPVAFTVGDPDGDPARLIIRVSSDDPELVDLQGLAVSGSGSARSLHLRPYSARAGSARITIQVSDGIDTVSRHFRLTVSPTTAAPEVTWSFATFLSAGNAFNTHPTANERWLARGSSHDLTIRVYDPDTPVYVDGEWVDSITTEVQSDAPAILPASAVVFARREFSTDTYDISLDLTSAPVGTVDLSLLAHDDTGNTGSATLKLHIVEPGNQAPEITSLGGEAAGVLLGTGLPLVLTAEDPDDGPAPLVTNWLLRTPWPSGFQFETLAWWIAPSGGAGCQRSWFTTGHAAQLVDGEYRFIAEVHDGVDLVSDEVTVSIANDPGGLVAWWALDEPDGRRSDAWRQGIDLQPVGPVTRMAGRRGWSAGFAGDGLLVARDQAQAAALGRAEQLAVALWCRPDGHEAVAQVIGKHSAAEPGWALQLIDGRPRLLVHAVDGTATTVTATGTLPIDTWSLLAATYDSSTGAAILYRDGTVIGSGDLTDDPATATAALTLGGRLAGEDVVDGFTGRLDRVTIHDAVVDATWLTDLRDHDLANQAPLASWTAPVDRQASPSGADVSCEWAVIDPEGDAVELQVLVLDGTGSNAVRCRPLATLASPPYRFTWSAPPDGTHVLMAVASDGQRHSATGWRFIHVGGTSNAAPEIESGPIADPSPVTGISTSLTATASDDAGVTGLQYDWSATGQAAVVFDPASSAGSGTASTTATFSKAGTYEITVTVSDAEGASAVATVAVPVQQAATVLEVQP